MKYQTKKDKVDEKIGMKHSKEAKYKQTMRDRRDESMMPKKAKKK